MCRATPPPRLPLLIPLRIGALGPGGGYSGGGARAAAATQPGPACVAAQGSRGGLSGGGARSAGAPVGLRASPGPPLPGPPPSHRDGCLPSAPARTSQAAEGIGELGLWLGTCVRSGRGRGPKAISGRPGEALTPLRSGEEGAWLVQAAGGGGRRMDPQPRPGFR